METPWIDAKQRARSLARNEAFWQGDLADPPLMWVTVADAWPGQAPPEPAAEESLWTDVDYLMAATEYQLGHTYFAGDSLPVFSPWLGPDQFAAWLGAELTLKPKDCTSWSKPFVDDWDAYASLAIDPENRWWKLYLQTLHSSVEAGRDKWVTGYPDLHTGIDGLAAIRGPDKLMVDIMTDPEKVHRAMRQTTELWKWIMDTVSDIILPAGQGTSHWAMGWSRQRYQCIGQNDFSCLIGPQAFVDFCWQDTRACCNYVDRALYHLDGPDAVRHLPKLLELENLDCVQWIQGAGNPLPSTSLEPLRRIQQAGKSIQLHYGGTHGGDADLRREIDILCHGLDPTRLFFWIITDRVEKADAIVQYARQVCR